MNSGNGASWEWRHIFRSRDLDETRAYLRQRFGPDVRSDTANVDVRIEGLDLPHMFMHHNSWGAPFTVEGTGLDRCYAMIVPTRGRFEVSSARSREVCSPRRAVIFCPTMPPSVLRTEGATTGFNLALSQVAVERQLAALLSEPIVAPLEFAPIVDLTTGYGGNFARYLLLAMADFQRPAPAPWNPIMASGFEDFIIAKLLVSHPHNYTAALRRAEKPLMPRDVKRAIDYMQARLGSPITIADIAAASGIAGRTLFKHFQDFHGISPMQYLRKARFEKAREALASAQPEESVAEIATNWGFTHMGRFSMEYRKRFGEGPAETIRRIGGHHRPGRRSR